MSNTANLMEGLKQKFASEGDKPYIRFIRDEGLEILSAEYVRDLQAVKLKPWARRGGKAVFLNHDASHTTNDCHVMEIAPGGKLNPHRQIFEEMVMVLSGRGSTTIWNNAGKRITFEWKAGALFGIPMNCWHQHFNGSGADPVRYVAVTNAPPIMNAYDNLDFIFNNDYDFAERFNGEPDYFSAKNDRDHWRINTNFIPDAKAVNLAAASERGAGGQHLRFTLARTSQAGHLSQFPVGTYKKAHAHGPGAHVIILSGEGYSLMWPDGIDGRAERFEWQTDTLIVPRNNIYHQHFNTGREPARYLAFRTTNSARNAQGIMKCFYSRRMGGDQLDYADETPQMRQMFIDSLAANGLEPRMQKAYDLELESLPPKP